MTVRKLSTSDLADISNMALHRTQVFSSFLHEKVQIWEMETNKVNRLYHLPCFSLQTISNIMIHF